MPLAATLATEEIYVPFLGKYEEFKTFFHGHSYTGNPLGCAVALANLQVFRKEQTLGEIASPKSDCWPDCSCLSVGCLMSGRFDSRASWSGIELVKTDRQKKPIPSNQNRPPSGTGGQKARVYFSGRSGTSSCLMPPFRQLSKNAQPHGQHISRSIADRDSARVAPRS